MNELRIKNAAQEVKMNEYRDLSFINSQKIKESKLTV